MWQIWDTNAEDQAMIFSRTRNHRGFKGDLLLKKLSV